jgi:hypothetical protein
MAWASSCKCMWAWFNSIPYPVWWEVESIGRTSHAIVGLTSMEGPVPVMTMVGCVKSESPGDIADALRRHVYRIEYFYRRPLELTSFDLSKVAVKHRHSYRYKAKHNKDFYQGKLF